MTSKEIFSQINPQAMLEQERQAKLMEAQTGLSKQQVVTGAMQQQQQMQMQNQQAPKQMPQQTNPNGWGRTA